MSRTRSRSHPTAGAAALVAGLAGKPARKSRSRRRFPKLLPGNWPLPGKSRRRSAGPVAALQSALAGRLPNRRQRRAVARRLHSDLDHLSKAARGIGTALGILATVAEVASNVRRHGGDESQGGRDEQSESSDEKEDLDDGDDGGEPGADDEPDDEHAPDDGDEEHEESAEYDDEDTGEHDDGDEDEYDEDEEELRAS